MGRWYEIASFPNWFQNDCTCTMAEYELQEDHVSVRNSCRKGSAQGQLDLATGAAYPVPGSGNSRLKVRFFWPFKGDYWILALDDAYQYAMIGHPSRKYLWILSRTPELSENIYQSLVAQAAQQGYDVSKLKRTLCSDASKGVSHQLRSAAFMNRDAQQSEWMLPRNRADRLPPWRSWQKAAAGFCGDPGKALPADS